MTSTDSQAYGVAARQTARKARASKTDAMVATTMARWHGHQIAAISARPPLPPTRTYTPAAKDEPRGDIETRITAAMEHLRELHEEGEVEWTDVSPQAAYEMAFLDD